MQLSKRESARIEAAYEEIRAQTKMVNVYLSDLYDKTGIEIGKIHSWALQSARSGAAELSSGDWSRSAQRQKNAAFSVPGRPDPFLLVGKFR